MEIIRTTNNVCRKQQGEKNNGSPYKVVRKSFEWQIADNQNKGYDYYWPLANHGQSL